MEKYGECLIIILLSLIMQGDNFATTPGYLFPIFSFVISKDMDKLWNYEGWNFNSGNYLFTTDTKYE